jgi:hypothetical protein
MKESSSSSKLCLQWKHIFTCMPIFMLLIGYEFILPGCINSVNFEGIEVCAI